MSTGTAAEWALMAVALVLTGAILTAGPVSIEQRAAVLLGIATVLTSIAWRRRRADRGDN